MIDLSNIESSGSGEYSLEFANEERENYNKFIEELEKDEMFFWDTKGRHNMGKFDKIDYKGFVIGNWYGSDVSSYSHTAINFMYGNDQHKYYVAKEFRKTKDYYTTKYLTKNLTLEPSCGIENMYETIEDAKVQIEIYLAKKRKREQFITEKEMTL